MPAKTHTHSNPPTEAKLEQYRELLRSHMARRGLRSTDQRKLIVEAFLVCGEHVSTEDLLARVRDKDSKIGYATVYRTLKLLAECGVALERRFADGLTRYELADADNHHDHMICLECGSITEFEEPEIEALQEQVAEKYGFELRSHKHDMYGICAECRKRRRST